VDPGRQRDLQHIALPTACALVYAGVTGCTPDARDAATLNLILNDVAFALSNLVPVYDERRQGSARPDGAAARGEQGDRDPAHRGRALPAPGLAAR